MKSYNLSSVLAWHEDYKDMSVTVAHITKKHNIKHDTLLKSFRKYGLWLRPSGFRLNNCKGKNGQWNIDLQYNHQFVHQYQRRAKRKGLDFTLTFDQFKALVTSSCNYCDKPHTEETRKVNKREIPMLSIDRVDSSKGYIPENCVPCCKICNTIKMDIPYDLWIEHLVRIVKKVGKL